MKWTKDCKVILNSMTKAEARAFTKFLLTEVLRHREATLKAEMLIDQVNKTYKLDQPSKSRASKGMGNSKIPPT